MKAMRQAKIAALDDCEGVQGAEYSWRPYRSLSTEAPVSVENYASVVPVDRLGRRRMQVSPSNVQIVTDMLTTAEAAAYMRRSVSWLVKQRDIPYLRGVPNTYLKKDLDDWFEKHKFHPRLN